MPGEFRLATVVREGSTLHKAHACLRLMAEAGDYGETGMDKELAAEVSIVELPTDKTGFTPWIRESEGGATRGTAEWLLPQKMTTTKKRVLFLHGGGYAWYSPSDVYRPLTTRIAAMSGLPVLAIDYRLLPEHPFPAAVQDGVAALNWLWKHSPDGEDPADQVFVVGDSAGGGLALAVSLGTLPCHKDFLGVTAPRPSGVIAFSAYTDITCSLPSYSNRTWDSEQCTGDPVFGMDRPSPDTAYVGKGAHPPTHPLASPYFAPPEQLKQLPPLLLMVGDHEVMLDDTVELARKIHDAGGDVECVVYRHMWHVWVLYSEGCGIPGGELEDAHDALRRCAEFMTRV